MILLASFHSVAVFFGAAFPVTLFFHSFALWPLMLLGFGLRDDNRDKFMKNIDCYYLINKMVYDNFNVSYNNIVGRLTKNNQMSIGALRGKLLFAGR